MYGIGGGIRSGNTGKCRRGEDKRCKSRSGADKGASPVSEQCQWTGNDPADPAFRRRRTVHTAVYGGRAGGTCRKSDQSGRGRCAECPDHSDDRQCGGLAVCDREYELRTESGHDQSRRECGSKMDADRSLRCGDKIVQVVVCNLL